VPKHLHEEKVVGVCAFVIGMDMQVEIDIAVGF
jgi:hypothetical protein